MVGGEAVTKLINPESIMTTNPLRAWIEDCLVLNELSAVPIGNNKNDNKTLYGHYSFWASRFGTEVSQSGFTKFSGLLIDVLKSMNWAVSKKRMSAGFVIQGISLKPFETLVLNSVNKDVATITHCEESDF